MAANSCHVCIRNELRCAYLGAQDVADLHGSLAAGRSLLQQVQNVQATLFRPPDSSPRDADGEGQEALSHVQESLAKLLLLLAALKVRTSKDRPGSGNIEIPDEAGIFPGLASQQD